MAIEVNLRDIQSGFLTATAFTQNNTLIEEAFSKAINREGGAGNSMQADLDMGLNSIINADNLDVNSITIDGTDYEAVVEAHRIAAANSAAAALASEQAAYSSEQAAALSEQNAASSEQATAQYLALFSTQYLGAHSAAPTVDDYGDPVQAGAMYWDTTVSKLYIYTGTMWGSTEQAFLDALQYTFDQDQQARADTFADFTQDMQDALDQFDQDQQDREDTFVASQADKEQRFLQFLADSGFVILGDYEAGIVVNNYNELIRDADGEFWRLSGSVSVPYTTDGTGMDENGSFVSAGDNVLRQDLASSTGTDYVGYGSGTLTDELVRLDIGFTVTTAQTGELSAYDCWLADSTAARSRDLPTAPLDGDEVKIVDDTANSEIFNITVGRNGKTIMGLAEDLDIDKNAAVVILKYIDSTGDWRLV